MIFGRANKKNSNFSAIFIIFQLDLNGPTYIFIILKALTDKSNSMDQIAIRRASLVTFISNSYKIKPNFFMLE